MSYLQEICLKQEGKIRQKTLQVNHIDTVSHSLGDLIPCLCWFMFNDVINAIAVCLKMSLCNDLTVKMNRKWGSMTSYLPGTYMHAPPGCCTGNRSEIWGSGRGFYLHAPCLAQQGTCMPVMLLNILHVHALDI